MPLLLTYLPEPERYHPRWGWPSGVLNTARWPFARSVRWGPGGVYRGENLARVRPWVAEDRERREGNTDLDGAAPPPVWVSAFVAYPDGDVWFTSHDPYAGPYVPRDAGGYDREGYSCAGYDRAGYDRAGYDREGYDREGYDREGYDRAGADRSGEHRRSCACSRCDVANYHSTDRDWRIPVSWQSKLLFGLEIELDCGTRESRRAAYRARPTGDLFLIGERDGSLDDDSGIEFVGPPMPISHYRTEEKAEANPWVTWLRRVQSEFGGDIPHPEHGMHVNISRAPILARDARKGDTWHRRFVASVNACQTLIQWVGGRLANEFCEFSWGDARFGEDSNKYRACNIKRDVIELRIFRATLDPARMLAIVQYTYAMLQWTKEGNEATGNACDQRLISWIRAQPEGYDAIVTLLEAYQGTTAGVDIRSAGPRCECGECGCSDCFPGSDGACERDDCDECNPCACDECGCERCYPPRYVRITGVRTILVEGGNCGSATCDDCNPCDCQECGCERCYPDGGCGEPECETCNPAEAGEDE